MPEFIPSGSYAFELFRISFYRFLWGFRIVSELDDMLILDGIIIKNKY
jgi:hypothetical protein